MNKIIRKLVYSKSVSIVLNLFLSIFYDRKYLTGKFFEEKRMGYMWALKSIFDFKRRRIQKINWPCSKDVTILNGENISFDPSSINIFFNKGIYFQAFAKIKIGKDVWIAQNVGLITANHDVNNLEQHDKPEGIVIGDKCWIGMNAVILPGVILGNQTIVGAGAVVTKSFEKGKCIIAGNPAKVIKYID